VATIIDDRKIYSRDFARLAEIEGRPEAPAGLVACGAPKRANAGGTAMIFVRGDR
jgi:hypothetical protein